MDDEHATGTGRELYYVLLAFWYTWTMSTRRGQDGNYIRTTDILVYMDSRSTTGDRTGTILLTTDILVYMDDEAQTGTGRKLYRTTDILVDMDDEHATGTGRELTDNQVEDRKNVVSVRNNEVDWKLVFSAALLWEMLSFRYYHKGCFTLSLYTFRVTWRCLLGTSHV
ncbi:hypothetical protein J6590_087637 [Homalodisca vitripennis]|nr:hypothetical protein J6590_087637 [Homalodisca vitripennis]